MTSLSSLLAAMITFSMDHSVLVQQCPLTSGHRNTTRKYLITVSSHTLATTTSYLQWNISIRAVGYWICTWSLLVNNNRWEPLKYRTSFSSLLGIISRPHPSCPKWSWKSRQTTANTSVWATMSSKWQSNTSVGFSTAVDLFPRSNPMIREFLVGNPNTTEALITLHYTVYRSATDRCVGLADLSVIILHYLFHYSDGVGWLLNPHGIQWRTFTCTQVYTCSLI